MRAAIDGGVVRSRPPATTTVGHVNPGIVAIKS
jgi:hypothetical protein